MKIKILSLAFFALFMASCAGESTEGAIDTTDHAAETYCKLSTEMDMAQGAEQVLLKGELDELENKIEAAHKGDENWMKEFEKKVETTCPKG